jgi:hypothetical protein
MRAPVRVVLLFAATLGCYGTPRTSFPEDDAAVGAGGATDSSGSGGSKGNGGATAGSGGSSAGERGGATADSGASSQGGNDGVDGNGGSTGGGGAGGAGLTFVGGPCTITPDLTKVEVFARSSDRKIYRRAFDGTNWGNWSTLSGVDATVIDARSDLDCSARSSTVHIVASGLSPVGALMHAFGSGTAFNPFVRELTTATFDPSPSIASTGDTTFTLGAVASTWPAVFEVNNAAIPEEITPIATYTGSFRSSPDIALQPLGGSGLTYFAAFDDTSLAIYYRIINSGGSHWADPVKLSPPTGTFAFAPTICTENNGVGVVSVNVAGVAEGKLWYARTPSISTAFSSWTQIAADVASSPDCTIAGATNSIVHIVALSTGGAVLDINGNGTSWVVTDLGLPR